MKGFIFIVFVTLFVSCKQNKPITESSSLVEKNDTTLSKESVFITMERTPCFGQCPSYKITIFNTGNVVYEGLAFTKKEGRYIKKLTQKQLSEIQAQIKIIKLFELEDKYDSRITDIPSTYLYVIYQGKKKKILDRDGAPNELKRFEKLIDFLVIDDNLKKQ